MPGALKKLFLSAVSSEFENYREILAKDLKTPDVDIAVQENFITTGSSTLEKLDDYIRACDGVVHLVGKAKGAVPEGPAVAGLLRRLPDLGAKLAWLAPLVSKPQPGLSYTQWEAYLALYHGRQLFVYLPADFESDDLKVPRTRDFRPDLIEIQAQKEHYQRLCELGHDRGRFADENRLSVLVLRGLLWLLPQRETSAIVEPTRLRHSAGRLIGRDKDLDELDAAWNDPNKNVVVVRAFGGVGKTSLITTWMATLAAKGWPGAKRVFDWTFYREGTSYQRNASAHAFIAAALRAFGDSHPTRGSLGDRGRRLAHVLAETRCLLVLDGLEPLQYPPGLMGGKLKDPGVEALLKGLCAHNEGLCVVTTRQEVTDIEQYYGLTAKEIKLEALTDLAGAALLYHHGGRRAGAYEIAPNHPELQKASHEAGGHGLTLQIVGTFLKRAFDGDILRRDRVKLDKADAKIAGGHAFRAMAAYAKWMEGGSDETRRELAILRLLGLFDRPATAGCMDALRAPPAIPGLTEPLTELEDEDWRLSIDGLESAKLVTVNRESGSGRLIALDAHPLLREYFGKCLREPKTWKWWLRRKQTEAWKAGHRRLYKHLCESTIEGENPTLEALEPLYQAVAHGCQAGLQQDAYDRILWERIQRRQKLQSNDELKESDVKGRMAHSRDRLGALGADLCAVSCFFQQPWTRPSPSLSNADQAWLLNAAGFLLRGLGRLNEAIEPTESALKILSTHGNFGRAAMSASNLSRLRLTLGDVKEAMAHAELSSSYANCSGDLRVQIITLTTSADAVHQSGKRNEAGQLFCEAERKQAGHQPAHPSLHSRQGFRYCDLLLAGAEREAGKPEGRKHVPVFLDACRSVTERTQESLKLTTEQELILDIALDHLTLGRAALYASILVRGLRPESLSSTSPTPAPESSQHYLELAAAEIDSAVSGLRSAGVQHHLPRGLLSRAWLRSVNGARIGADSAQSNLDEAWEIAQRGPMPLFLADIHLYRARLFFRESNYPWGSARQDLKEAWDLIGKCGYWRRKEELQDAESAILGKSGLGRR